MIGMFEGADAFNQNLSSWDVSNGMDMSGMFQNAEAFNQNLSNWKVQNVKRQHDKNVSWCFILQPESILLECIKHG
jgi:surface protein